MPDSITRATAAAARAPRPNRVVLRCPDLTLKGRNRKEFEEALVRNVRRRLRGAGLDWPVRYARGRAYVEIVDTAALPAALEALSEVTGVDSLTAAVWLRPRSTGQYRGELSGGRLEEALVALAAERFLPDHSFAVRVNRVDKQLATTSQQLERRLGELIRRHTGFDRVDLDRPDVTFRLDIYPDGIYLSADRRPGFGGLPVGTAGSVLALLSGGIDSPVAAFLMAKRGCAVDLLHMTAGHAQLALDGSPVVRLAARLSRFTLATRLICVPSTRFDLALEPGSGYEAILFRRFLARVGETVARRLGAGALVSGDSLGQVASQTLENLSSVSDAVETPILRPLVAFNKEEIILLSRRLGTFEASIEPYKDCCALHSHRPRTRSSPPELREIEAELGLAAPALLEGVLEDAVWHLFECGEPCGGWQPLEQPAGGVPRGGRESPPNEGFAVRRLSY